MVAGIVALWCDDYSVVVAAVFSEVDLTRAESEPDVPFELA